MPISEIVLTTANAIAFVFAIISYAILAVIIWRQWKMINDLLDRFMADNFKEYKVVKAKTERPDISLVGEKEKRVNDPILGGRF